MINQEFLNSDLFKWAILPLLIFIARMSDVSLGTMRHILVARGMKKIVPFLGFFVTSSNKGTFPYTRYGPFGEMITFGS